MAIENLFTDDLTRVTDKELEEAIVQLARSGVEEGFRLDFKELWNPDKQVPDVAALANSYGGLIIIGVSDDRQRFPGATPPKNSDLKTQISSTIASRISPVPIFEVRTCPAPANPTNELVIIRISQQPQVHLYLNSDKPIYVRNEDQTIPARAPQVQALLERVQNADASAMSPANPLAEFARDFYVTKAQDRRATLAARQALENRRRSDTTLLIGVAPERPLNIAIDVTLEQKFKDLVHSVYPSIAHPSQNLCPWDRYSQSGYPQNTNKRSGTEDRRDFAARDSRGILNPR